MQHEQKSSSWKCDRTTAPTLLIVYCSDFKCSHSIIVDAKPWSDEIRLADLEPRFTRMACGQRGADARPLFERAAKGIGIT
jgi:hypothetical protein